MNKILMFGAFAPKGVEYFKEKSAGRYELAFGSTRTSKSTTMQPISFCVAPPWTRSISLA